MSDPSSSDQQQPSTSGGSSSIPGPQPIQPTSSRTIRRRRPTAIPQDVTVRKEVKILRPSEVPEREPMPEYKSYGENRKTVPNHVPLDQLHTHYDNDERKVVIPDFMSAEDLIALAENSKEVISFRTTNHVDPDKIWDEIQASEAAGKPRKVDDIDIEYRYPMEDEGEIRKAFIERSSHCIGKTVHGVFTKPAKPGAEHLSAILTGPEGSIYEGGTYFIKIVCYAHPQFKYIVPYIKFDTMMFHPSLGKYGAYDVRSLIDDNWNHKSSLQDVYRWLSLELANIKRTIARKNQEQLEGMAQPDIALLASSNWEQFERIAREMTWKMAGGGLKMSKVMPGRLKQIHDYPKSKVAVEVGEEDTYVDVETVDDYRLEVARPEF